MPARSRRRPDLLADIGGTNARFALRLPGRGPSHLRILPTRDYAGLAAAVRAYLAGVAPETRPRRAAVAVASPVIGDRVHLTNRDWTFSTSRLKRALGLRSLVVINDFAAIARAIPALRSTDWHAVGGARPERGAPIAVIGPGTGLGIALLVPAGDRYVPVATEGGHVTLPADNDDDAELIAALRKRFAHVSAERVLSGPGLANLYQAIAARRGVAVLQPDPAAITEAALAGGDPLADAALDAFCNFLGAVAGNLALTTGARGGVYIAGGIVPRFADRLARTAFRRRFEQKGRFKAWLAPIPVRVITRRQPALLGLGRLLDEAD